MLKILKFLIIVIFFIYIWGAVTKDDRRIQKNLNNASNNEATLRSYYNKGWEYGYSRTKNTTPVELVVIDRGLKSIENGISINCYHEEKRLELKIKDLSNNTFEGHLNKRITVEFSSGKTFKFNSTNDLFPELDNISNPELFNSIVSGMIESKTVKFENEFGHYAIYDLTGFTKSSEVVLRCDSKEYEELLNRDKS